MASTGTITPVIDLTLALDPAEFYGDDMGGCPDWPVAIGINPGADVSRPADAEKQLERLRAALNVADSPLRAPSKAEMKSLRDRYFTDEKPVGFEHPDEACWRNRHGIAGLIPRDPSQINLLNRIIEAAHIRGHLLKAAARNATAQARHTQAQTQRAQHDLEHSTIMHGELVAEFDGLAEAAARHVQRIDDERAFHRRWEIKRNVLPGHASQIRAAANTLGVSPPILPMVE